MSFPIKVEGCLNYLMEEQSKGTKMQKTDIRAAEKVFIPGRKHRPEQTSKNLAKDPTHTEQKTQT